MSRRPNFSTVAATAAIGIYDVPKVDVTTVALHTRGVTAGSMRGYGTLQTMTALKVLIDEAANGTVGAGMIITCVAMGSALSLAVFDHTHSALAVAALADRQVGRIILTRPAVEAGERLGFLPGTLSEKIDPYLRPLYDALHDMIEPDRIPRLMTSGTIEVAPLAYMRGRTLNDAFIILDEAQNTTPEQMKMFLTRLGFGSTMVVTGDVTQVDLPGGVRSGLRLVQDILTDVEDVAFCKLTSNDVVRHELVARIVDAYGRWDAEREAQSPRGLRG